MLVYFIFLTFVVYDATQHRFKVVVLKEVIILQIINNRPDLIGAVLEDPLLPQHQVNTEALHLSYQSFLRVAAEDRLYDLAENSFARQAGLQIHLTCLRVRARVGRPHLYECFERRREKA